VIYVLLRNISGLCVMGTYEKERRQFMFPIPRYPQQATGDRSHTALAPHVPYQQHTPAHGLFLLREFFLFSYEKLSIMLRHILHFKTTDFLGNVEDKFQIYLYVYIYPTASVV
jgi:hypothetical protein